MTAIVLALAMIFPRPVGLASWYADPRAPQGSLYAAVPGWSGHSYYVTVTAGERRVRVRVIDTCQCHAGTASERAIDLSWTAFSRLAPLSRGLVRVVIER